MPPIRFLGVAIALSTATAHADLSPDWITEVPAGSALTAGLKGMVTAPSGVSYLTGVVGPSSNTDIRTAAIDTDGTVLWQHVFNGPGNWHDQARGIALGPAGVVYVTGNTPGPGNYANLLLLKYDASSGTLLDTVQFSSELFTSEHGATVAVDEQGNVYVGGGTVGDGADGLMVSFDAEGHHRWTRTYDGPAFGPYSQDHVRQVQVDPDGNVLAMVHGVMSSLHPDYVVIKYSGSDGTTMWQANWGVSGGDFARDMAIDAQGDIYVTGIGIDFIDRISTIKLAGSSGQLLWQEYDSVGFDHAASAIALDGLGGVYITGSSDPDGDDSNFNDDFFTIKRDATTGAQQWTHVYGDDCVGCLDVPADVIVDSAGHVLVVGSTSSAPYGNDMILFALDSATGLEIDRGVVGGDPGELAGGSILRLDADDEIYVGGGYSNANTGAVGMAVFKFPEMPGAVPDCPHDLDGDGVVGVADLVSLILAWGSCADCPADIDGDGTVSVTDLVELLTAWGSCPG